MAITKVLYTDQTSGMVEEHLLEELIATGKIAAFTRSNEWIVIDRDPIRGTGGEYYGPERRKKGRALEPPSDFFG